MGDIWDDIVGGVEGAGLVTNPIGAAITFAGDQVFNSGGGTDALGKTLFGGNWDPAKYNQPGLNPQTRGLIGSVGSEAGKSPEDLKKSMMEGTESYRGFLPNSQSIGNEESALGMTSSQSQKDALSARNQRSYDRELSALNRTGSMEAHQMQLQRLEQAHKVLQAKDEWAMNVAGSQIQSILNERAARGAVIGDILGTAGAVLGTVMGGPAGGKAGAAAGEGMGGGKTSPHNSGYYSGL